MHAEREVATWATTRVDWQAIQSYGGIVDVLVVTENHRLGSCSGSTVLTSPLATDRPPPCQFVDRPYRRSINRTVDLSTAAFEAAVGLGAVIHITLTSGMRL